MQKKPPIINIVIAALLALLTVLIGLLSGFAPNELPQAVTPYLRFTWPLLGIATLAFIGLTIWLTARQSASDDGPISSNEHRQQSIEKQNRQRMLAKVHAFWIKGVLEQSLHDAALIALGLKGQPDAVANPWRLVLQQPDQSEHPLPSGTRITRVYDDVGGELLILGEPGSGKTTLLLELARDLLDRAKKDEMLPMPVVFNLSSWAVKQQPITEWLIEELHTNYQVPRKLGLLWVDADQVLPLLDGLDEVASKHRSACVDAINAYRQEHGLVPTVVCSRSTEYLSQVKRMLLRSAVVVQPLTAQQIDDYLSSAGGQMAAVHKELRKDTELQELVSTPLMLSILTLAYQGKSIDDLLSADSSERYRQQVFATYIQRMLQRRGIETQYTQQQTMHWLTWLAKQMKQHNQTKFFIEMLQPDWLLDNRLQLFYYNTVGGLVGMIFAFCLIVASITALSNLSIALVTGLLIGAFVGIFNRIRFPIGLIVGLPFGLIAGIIFGLRSPQHTGLGGALLGIAFGGLAGFFVDDSIRKAKGIIEPVESVNWSWVGFRESLVPALSVGSIIGLVSGVIFILIPREYFVLGGSIILSFIGGVLVALIFTFLVTIVWSLRYGGMVGRVIAEHHSTRPNQGIRTSARNALFVILLFALIAVVFRAITLYLRDELLLQGLASNFAIHLVLSRNLDDVVIGGLSAGLIFGFPIGGLPCVQHAVLRFLLWHARCIPLNYPRFLDYATDRILLRKVGGGYIFIHRLLLEYFTSLDTATNSSGKAR